MSGGAITHAWPLQTHLELAALPTAPGCARDHVRSLTYEWGVPALADIAELLVSELVTNAVQASELLQTRANLATVPAIRLWTTSDGACLVIHVWDASDQLPVLKESATDAENGRGLLLVSALGKDWGAYRKTEGKVVWVMITADDP
jgi:anti-sigma regulatory factor (Ser/Thr protein kinase)